MAEINHDPEYIRWVQYSLNRLISAWIVTDGKVTDYYRNCVSAFQVIAKAPIPHGLFDKDSHLRLIAINNVGQNRATKIYLKWAQTALRDSGFYIGPTDGVLTPDTKSAIKSFQKFAKHKNLDGIIGPKTERDLKNYVRKYKVPGYYPGGMKLPDPVEPGGDPINVPADPKTINALKENWTRTFIREFEEGGPVFASGFKNTAVKCMLKKLLSVDGFGNHHSNNYEYLNADKIARFDVHQSLQSITSNALDVLRFEISRYPPMSSSEHRYNCFKDSIENLYLRINYGIRHIFRLKTHASGSQVGVYAVLEGWYDRQFADKTSLISCFPPPPDSEIFPPPPQPDI
jgi:hypothetical protein